MKSYVHEIYNESGPNMAAIKSVLHNLYFLVTLPLMAMCSFMGSLQEVILCNFFLVKLTKNAPQKLEVIKKEPR